jgi:hypothetical protein
MTAMKWSILNLFLASPTTQSCTKELHGLVFPAFLYILHSRRKKYGGKRFYGTGLRKETFVQENRSWGLILHYQGNFGAGSIKQFAPVIYTVTQ